MCFITGEISVDRRKATEVNQHQWKEGSPLPRFSLPPQHAGQGGTAGSLVCLQKEAHSVAFLDNKVVILDACFRVRSGLGERRFDRLLSEGNLLPWAQVRQTLLNDLWVLGRREGPSVMAFPLENLMSFKPWSDRRLPFYLLMVG